MKRIVQVIFYVTLCSHIYAQQVSRTEAVNADIKVMSSRGISVQSRDVDSVFRLEKNGYVIDLQKQIDELKNTKK